MIDMQGVLVLQGQLFLLMAIGFYLRRHVVGEGFQKGMTDLVVDVVLPCNILVSFEVDLSGGVLAESILITVLSLLIQAGCYILARLLFGRCKEEQKPSLQYAIICSNAGFLGTPVAEGIFGSEGVLLSSFYLIPQRVAMWTLGVSFFEHSGGKGAWKKVLGNHCIIATEIGLFLMLTGLSLPSVFTRVVHSLSSCNTALSMLLIGMLMSDVKGKDFLDPMILWFSGVRLLLIPLLVFLGCRLGGVEGLTLDISVILAAMPAGGTTAILAAKYERNAAFAAGLVTVSTILSIAAIPLWGLILQSLA